MKQQLPKIGSLKTSYGNYPCGTSVSVETIVKAGVKFYRTWASFSKRPETFVGELPANLISFKG